MMYPLVNVYITTENHHFNGTMHYFDWAIFQFANCRCLPEGMYAKIDTNLELSEVMHPSHHHPSLIQVTTGDPLVKPHIPSGYVNSLLLKPWPSRNSGFSQLEQIVIFPSVM